MRLKNFGVGGYELKFRILKMHLIVFKRRPYIYVCIYVCVFICVRNVSVCMSLNFLSTCILSICMNSYWSFLGLYSLRFGSLYLLWILALFKLFRDTLFGLKTNELNIFKLNEFHSTKLKKKGVTISFISSVNPFPTVTEAFCKSSLYIIQGFQEELCFFLQFIATTLSPASL